MGSDNDGVREEWNRGVGRECWGEVLGWISNKWLYTYTIDLHSQICTVHDAPCWPKCMLESALRPSMIDYPSTLDSSTVAHLSFSKVLKSLKVHFGFGAQYKNQPSVYHPHSGLNCRLMRTPHRFSSSF